MPKILIVEDNAMNLDMLSRRLQRRGYEIFAASDGESGIVAARSALPDLILMDLSLPGLDGWEATEMLKADPDLRDTPIIALTAHAMRGDREKAMEAGCDDYATKPVDLPSLVEMIERHLSESSES